MNILKNSFYIYCLFLSFTIPTSAHKHQLLAHEIDDNVLKVKNIWGSLKLSAGLAGCIALFKLPQHILSKCPVFEGIEINLNQPYNSMEEMKDDFRFKLFWQPYLKKNLPFWLSLAESGYNDISFGKTTRAEALKYLFSKTTQKLITF